MKKLFTLVAAMFVVISINATNEVTLWEGIITSTGWSGQYVLSDGGTELKNANAKAGDEMLFYLNGDEGWSAKIVEGHWGAAYAVFNAENLNADGVASLTLTQAILDAAYTQQYWGGTFILNGDGNVTLTKVTLKPATADGIRNAKLSTNVLDKDALMYNLAGQRVSSSYKGVVIQNGNPFFDIYTTRPIIT